MLLMLSGSKKTGSQKMMIHSRFNSMVISTLTQGKLSNSKGGLIINLKFDYMTKMTITK